MLAVAIPTCCHTPEEIRIGYSLQSLAMQVSGRFEIFVWDEGPVPVVSNRWVRLIIDLLTDKGHTVNYLRRRPSLGVAAARRGLLKEASSQHSRVLMIDDDLVAMPDAIEKLLEASTTVEAFGFLQGTKIELDPQRTYFNDINQLNEFTDALDLRRLYFGDAAFLLVETSALQYVDWDIVTKYREEGLAGEDVTMSLMIADKLPCFGVPSAVGYHLSLPRPRWRWEMPSDILQIELLRGIVSDETLKAALPHLAHYL